MKSLFSSPDPTRLFLTFDANVNLKDKFHGNTALHWACSSGNHVAVKLLIDAGSSLEVKNDKVSEQIDEYCCSNVDIKTKCP